MLSSLSQVWTLAALAYVGYFVLKTLRKLRRYDLSYLGDTRTIEVGRAFVPPEAAQALSTLRPTASGMTPYGVVTASVVRGEQAFAEVWLDHAGTTIVQVMWLKSPKGKTQTFAVVSSYLGNPASAALVCTTNFVAGLTSGQRPGEQSLRLPGVGTDRLVEVHRRQLAAATAVPLRFPDLASVRSMLDAGGSSCHQWRLGSGRLEQTADGEVRLSIVQCLWWILRSDLLLKALYRWQVRARSQWTVRRLPAARPDSAVIRQAA